MRTDLYFKSYSYIILYYINLIYRIYSNKIRNAWSHKCIWRWAPQTHRVFYWKKNIPPLVGLPLPRHSVIFSDSGYGVKSPPQPNNKRFHHHIPFSEAEWMPRVYMFFFFRLRVIFNMFDLSQWPSGKGNFLWLLKLKPRWFHPDGTWN